MKMVGAFEAKTHFNELLKKASSRRCPREKPFASPDAGAPVAKLVPDRRSRGKGRVELRYTLSPE